MKYTFFLIIQLVLFTFVSSNAKCQNFLSVINYEESLKDRKSFKLSDLASNVEYIKFETNDKCLIQPDYAKYYFTNNYIFVSNKDHILKFSKNGKFIKKIGNPGRGPGEMIGILSVSILPEKELIVIQEYGGRRLLYFTFEGNFIKSVQIPFTVRFLMMNNMNYLTYDENGYSKYIFRLSNEKGDTISGVKNNYNWINTSQKISAAPSYPYEPFYYYGNNYYFKASHTDTIYSIHSNKIKPYYFIDLGSYKLPDELRSERDLTKFMEKRSSYYYCSVFEISNFLFISSFCYGKDPTKFIYFNKATLKGSLLVNTTGKSTGFINDWDGGLDFCPVGNLDDNKAYMPINIIQLKEMLDKQSQNTVKNKANQILLEKLIHDSDILDNPILMIVTLK